jgi:hypothetical protein
MATPKEILTFSEKEIEADRNAFELKKTRAFLHLVLNLRQIGVILRNEKPLLANIQQVEKWPIVQAFALDGFLNRRRGRFFHFKEKSCRRVSTNQTTIWKLRPKNALKNIRNFDC